MQKIRRCGTILDIERGVNNYTGVGIHMRYILKIVANLFGYVRAPIETGNCKMKITSTL